MGRLKQDRWTGSDGKNHSRVAIVAEHVEYRSDFRKGKESASEAEALAETAAETEDEMEEAEVEEYQAIAF